MLFGQLVLLLLLWTLLLFVPPRTFAQLYLASDLRGQWTTSRLGLGVGLLLALLVATRSPGFGVDTVAYVNLFSAYCRGDDLSTLEASFRYSIGLLNGAMLGGCKVDLLPAAWVGLVVIAVLVTDARLEQKGAYLALFLFSLVGIELTTNALRQSLSVGLTVIAVSHWPKRRVLASVAAALAVGLHSSAALVLLALVGASLGWKMFLAGSATAIIIVAISLPLGAAAFLIGPLLFEITKYLGHESDEVFVRLMAAVCVVIALAAPLLAAAGREQRRAIASSDQYGNALRLAITCIPFLPLPYFGYRYIYGIFPLVLWLVLGATTRFPVAFGRTFGWTLAGQVMILIVWSQGSSYMRTVPFYG